MFSHLLLLSHLDPEIAPRGPPKAGNNHIGFNMEVYAFGPYIYNCIINTYGTRCSFFLVVLLVTGRMFSMLM